MSASICSCLFFIAVVSALAVPRTPNRRTSIARGLLLMAMVQIVALIASLVLGWHPWAGILLTLPLATLILFLDLILQQRRGHDAAILPGLCAVVGVVGGFLCATFGTVRRDSLKWYGTIVSSDTLVGLHFLLMLLSVCVLMALLIRHLRRDRTAVSATAFPALWVSILATCTVALTWPTEGDVELFLWGLIVPPFAIANIILFWSSFLILARRATRTITRQHTA